jgi:Sortase domain
VATALCGLAAGITWAHIGPADDHDEPTSPAGPRGAPGAAVSALPAVPARRTGAVRPEVPTRSILPDGRDVPIRAARTASDGSLDVPEDIRVAGWWQGGARLGDPFGSTLLAAHVDSFTQGLGPYASLLAVRPGQQITLSSAHLSQTFSVVSLALVHRGTLSRHPRIFSARGPRRLTLVTCAGPYIPARGGYQNLAVVTALPAQDVVRKAAR